MGLGVPASSVVPGDEVGSTPCNVASAANVADLSQGPRAETNVFIPHGYATHVLSERRARCEFEANPCKLRSTFAPVRHNWARTPWYPSGVQNILVADDDPHIREVIRFALEQAGYVITEADSGLSALEAARKHKFDVFILDILMPGADGLEVCRQLRKESRVPILFVSSRDEELDRVLGLELGADDYIAKPFSPRELVARVRAVLRRTTAEPTTTETSVLRRGTLALDLGRHTCHVGTAAITLTVTEFSLLHALAERPGMVLTREQIVASVYGHGHFITDRTVDSHVRRLRKKLTQHTADFIETVYGLGYRFREEP